MLPRSAPEARRGTPATAIFLNQLGGLVGAKRPVSTHTAQPTDKKTQRRAAHVSRTRAARLCLAVDLYLRLPFFAAGLAFGLGLPLPLAFGGPAFLLAADCFAAGACRPFPLLLAFTLAGAGSGSGGRLNCGCIASNRWMVSLS